MTIATRDQLINAMANNSSRIIIDKASMANAVTGAFQSLWRANGQPGQGAIPTAAATCDNTLVGALQFAQQTLPATSYLAVLESMCSNASTTIEIHDRIMHMAGLSGIVATSQTVNLDVHANIGLDNIAARIGDTNYSDVQWWLEVYTDMGATAANATISVTYNDGTTGNLSVQAVGGTLRAGRMLPLNNLVPAAQSGKFIRAINSVIHTTTGTAGNYGFTATRYRCALFQPVANARFTADWAALGLPEIANESCLFPVQVAGATSTGAVRATGKIIHG